MTKRDANEDEIERWIAALNGRGDSPDDGFEDNRETSRIRAVLLQQQRRAEDQFDDLRLERGRKQLLAAMTTSEQRYDQRRLLTLAASIVLVLFVGSVFLVNDPAGLFDDGSVKSLDGSDAAPEAVTTIILDPVNVGAAAARIGQRLEDAGLAFDTLNEDDGAVVLTITVDRDEDIQALSSVLLDFAAPEILLPGTYRVRIQ